METLDRLLRRLKAKGHRVVLFSQFTRFLDIIDDYLTMKGYSYVRLDGNVNRVQVGLGSDRVYKTQTHQIFDHALSFQPRLPQRMVDIQEFNKPNSPHFVFLMSTRAGGLGVNLYTADTVILMDSDWNPQVDMQVFDELGADFLSASRWQHTKFELE